MKKMLLLFTSSLFLVTYSHAQLSKGQKMIGGELSFTSSNNEYDGFQGAQKITSVNIAPQIGFGLSKNWVVGAGLGFTYESQKAGSGSDYKLTANIYSVGLFARKFHPFAEKFGVFGELGTAGGFGKVKESQGSLEAESDVSTIAVTLRPGFYFKATKRLILEANFGGLSYSHLTSKDEMGYKSNRSEFRFQLTSLLGFGAQFVL